MVKQYKKGIEDVLEILKQNKQGLTVKDVAEKLGLNRNATAKYMDVLKAFGKVEMKEVGPAKIFTIARKPSVSELLDYCSEMIVLIDDKLNIIQANKAFLKRISADGKDLIGKKINECGVEAFQNKEVIDKISLAFAGYDYEFETIGNFGNATINCKFQSISIILKDGKNGVAIIVSDITKNEDNYGFFADVVVATSILMSTNCPAVEFIEKTLERLGNTTATSRVYLFVAEKQIDGEVIYSRKKEWVANRIKPVISNSSLQTIVLEKTGFERWKVEFEKGNVIKGLVKEFPEKERNVYIEQGVISLLCIPVIKNNKCVGFIGFDDCKRERIWSAQEISTLKVIASMIGVVCYDAEGGLLCK